MLMMLGGDVCHDLQQQGMLGVEHPRGCGTEGCAAHTVWELDDRPGGSMLRLADPRRGITVSSRRP